MKPSTEIPEDPVPDIPPPHSRMSKKGPTTAKSVEPSNDRRSPQKPTAKRKASLKPNSPVAQTVPHEDQQPRLVSYVYMTLTLAMIHSIYDPQASLKSQPSHMDLQSLCLKFCCCYIHCHICPLSLQVGTVSVDHTASGAGCVQAALQLLGGRAV